MYGIHNGFVGLLEGDIIRLNWLSVNGWASDGGAYLGTNRYVPKKEQFHLIKEQLHRHNIDALIIIGGFEAYT